MQPNRKGRMEDGKKVEEEGGESRLKSEFAYRRPLKLLIDKMTRGHVLRQTMGLP